MSKEEWKMDQIFVAFSEYLTFTIILYNYLTYLCFYWQIIYSTTFVIVTSGGVFLEICFDRFLILWLLFLACCWDYFWCFGLYLTGYGLIYNNVHISTNPNILVQSLVCYSTWATTHDEHSQRTTYFRLMCIRSDVYVHYIKDAWVTGIKM